MHVGVAKHGGDLWEGGRGAGGCAGVRLLASCLHVHLMDAAMSLLTVTDCASLPSTVAPVLLCAVVVAD
jgi:hypothetical protein